MSEIGDKIDELYQLRESKRALEEQLKDINKEMVAIESDLIDQMDAAKTSKSATDTASVSISKSVVPAVEDWDKFYDFIQQNGYFHMLERRPAALACREMFEQGGQIPGVVPFVKRKLNIKSK